MPEQGMLRLSAPGVGILTQVRVAEGQKVKKAMCCLSSPASACPALVRRRR